MSHGQPKPAVAILMYYFLSMNNVSSLLIGTGTGLNRDELDYRCVNLHNQLKHEQCDSFKRPGKLYEVTSLIVVNILKLHFSIITPLDGSWGSHSGNRSTGLVLDLQDGRIDTTVPILDFTSARFQATRFSIPPVTSTQGGFLVSSDFNEPSWAIFQYWRIFDLWTNSLIVLTALILYGLSTLMGFTSERSAERYSRRPYFDLIMAILSFLIMATFSGKVVSQRSVDRFHRPFSTLSGATPLIARGEYRWYTSDENAASINLIMGGSVGRYEPLRRALINYPPIFIRSFDDFSHRLHSNRKAFYFGSTSYNHGIAFHSGGKLRAFPDRSATNLFQGFMFNPEAKKLTNLFSRASFQLFEAGIIQKIDRKYGMLGSNHESDLNAVKMGSKAVPFKLTDFNLTFATFFSLIGLYVILMTISLHFKNFHLKDY